MSDSIFGRWGAVLGIVLCLTLSISLFWPQPAHGTCRVTSATVALGGTADGDSTAVVDDPELTSTSVGMAVTKYPLVRDDADGVLDGQGDTAGWLLYSSRDHRDYLWFLAHLHESAPRGYYNVYLVDGSTPAEATHSELIGSFFVNVAGIHTECLRVAKTDLPTWFGPLVTQGRIVLVHSRYLPVDGVFTAGPFPL